MKLKDKVCLITGAAYGLGKCVAQKFSDEGAITIIADIDSQAAQATVSEINAKGGKAHSIDTDVRKSSDVDNLFNQIKKKFNKLDVLINNAGLLFDSTLVKLREEDYDQLVDTNMKGTFLCGQGAARLMVEQKSGIIINCSSVAGLYGGFAQTCYAASKAAVIAMVNCWARELGPKGIRVNAVCPGPFESRMISNLTQEQQNALIPRLILRRFGKPEELANVYVFLASDESSYINGATIEVSGDAIY